ncbi:MAG: hypothetical protein V7709_03855 [Halioglobus sp.]
MPASDRQSMPQDKFLTMAANLLYKAFLDSSRTKAKNLFREMSGGKVLPLTNVQLEDKSQIRVDIALDYSEYRGAINFGAFRSSVAMLVSRLGEQLKKGEDVRVFSADHDADIMIFGITAVTREDKDPNVMVLGAEMASERPSVLLKLMYIDPAQFAAEPEEAAS